MDRRPLIAPVTPSIALVARSIAHCIIDPPVAPPISAPPTAFIFSHKTIAVVISGLIVIVPSLNPLMMEADNSSHFDTR